MRSLNEPFDSSILVLFCLKKDSFKEEIKMMAMGLTEGLKIKIYNLLSHLHQQEEINISEHFEQSPKYPTHTL